MKIVRVLGGLGNQMFQYAFYLSLLEKGFDAKIDITQLRNYKLHNGYELENIFNINPQIATYDEVKKLSRNRKNEMISKLCRKFLPEKSFEYLEKSYSIYDEGVYNTIGDTYYQGYWHNEKYFNGIKNIVIKNFTLKHEFENRNLEILQEIENRNSVSIHVRRGDYVNHPYLSNICNDEYYSNAISKIQSIINKPIFYIFSDDIEYCKVLFQSLNAIYINHNNEKNSHYDMFLMSKCKHNIIANSSFSWWGAWLNCNPNKIVIGPSKWNFRDKKFDILPEKWLKIET